MKFSRTCHLAHAWRVVVPRRLAVARALLAAALALTTHTLPAQIYVVNHDNGTIGKYTLSGETINASLISGLNSPTGIAVSGEHLYVAQINGTVRQYTTDGVLVNPALITGLYGPWGIAISGKYLFVANGGGPGSTIGKYTISGAPVNTALVSGLDNPTGLEVAGDYLYVSEWSSGRIGKYTTSGATVNPLLIRGLTYPGGLAIDQNALYVSTLYGGVGKYTPDGVPLAGSFIPNAYNSGIGLALDGFGHLLVANNYGGAGGNRIALFNLTGELLNANFITGLRNPVDIAVVPEPVTALLAVMGLGLARLRRVP